MTTKTTTTFDDAMDAITHALGRNDLPFLAETLNSLSPSEVVDVLERLGKRHGGIVYRLLQKDLALEVFETLQPSLQGDLVHALQDEEVTNLFAELDPDDRVWLLDELPAKLAPKLLRDLTKQEREMTGALLGYPQRSIGRRMSPEYVTARPGMTVEQTLERVRQRADEAETIYALPVTDDSRLVLGVVSLRQLVIAESERSVESLMQEAKTALATDDAEQVARECTELGFLALPIVDSEGRLVGLLTIDDAVRILEQEETEDALKQGGIEPFGRPYLSTPVRQLFRSRIVWLLVLGIGATLTVRVMSQFEDTLAELTMLAVFIPLLIDTGGNAGSQSATTITRSIALGDVRGRDALRVVARELRVGLLLGLGLGLIALGITGVIFGINFGIVIGLTLVAICTMASTVGGLLPIVASKIKVDPAVFSNPFITTLVDAIGLIIYFLIASAVLGI